MNLFIERLKNIVEERRAEGLSNAVIINILKEELQYPVLDFIYNNRAYSHLIMYGGTLLRIAYGLPRMSEDLDFQTGRELDFDRFIKDITAHFKSTYNADITVNAKTERSTGTELAFISFPDILKTIGIEGYGLFTVLKIRVDVNHFSEAEKFATEMIPIVRGNYAFSIKTYHLSTLMASKVAAVLLRTKRGMGDEMADCKPRDIYDLMWYMSRKEVPNLEYLRAIHNRAGEPIEAKTVLDIFDHLMKRIYNLDDKLFARDLELFFHHKEEYDDWHRNWRDRFRFLRNEYEIYEIKKKNGEPELLEIRLSVDFSSDNHHILFIFATDETNLGRIKFVCSLSEYWYMFVDITPVLNHRKPEIEEYVKSSEKITDLDYEYAGLFYEKIVDYIKHNHYVMLQSGMKTKLIRATGDNLNVKTQIFLDARLLLKAKWEDLI